jgi:hypothetical protein
MINFNGKRAKRNQPGKKTADDTYLTGLAPGENEHSQGAQPRANSKENATWVNKLEKTISSQDLELK